MIFCEELTSFGEVFFSVENQLETAAAASSPTATHKHAGVESRVRARYWRDTGDGEILARYKINDVIISIGGRSPVPNKPKQRNETNI